MDKVEALATNVVFVGDFNLDVLKLGGDLNKVSDLCINLQLYQMVKSPTRITPSSSTCIDLLFSSIPEAHVVTDVIPLFISDNYMVFTVLNFKVIKQPPKIVKLRNYANFDSQAFYRDILHIQYL